MLRKRLCCLLCSCKNEQKKIMKKYIYLQIRGLYYWKEFKGECRYYKIVCLLSAGFWAATTKTPSSRRLKDTRWWVCSNFNLNVAYKQDYAILPIKPIWDKSQHGAPRTNRQTAPVMGFCVLVGLNLIVFRDIWRRSQTDTQLCVSEKETRLLCLMFYRQGAD